MIDDVFVEYFVKRQKTTANKMFKICTTVATVLLIIFINVILILLGINIIFFTGIASFGIGYLCYWVNKRQNVEYEVSLTNDIFTVSKIYNETKREMLTEFTLQECRRIAPVTDDSFKGDVKSVSLVLNATELHDYAIDESNWYCFVESDGAKYIVIFEFKDKMYKAFRRYNPRNTAFKRIVEKEED